MGPAGGDAGPDPHRRELDPPLGGRDVGLSLGWPADPFFFQTQAGTYTDARLIPFLRALKRHFRGRPVLLIWDGLGAHKGRRMRAYVARQRAWVTLDPLPAYAPELNPLEQVCVNVKGHELANYCAPDLAAVRSLLRSGFARVRSRRTWSSPSCATQGWASDMITQLVSESHERSDAAR